MKTLAKPVAPGVDDVRMEGCSDLSPIRVGLHFCDNAAALGAAKGLKPGLCYSVIEAQECLNIPAALIIEAVHSGDITRSLGCGPEMHVLGIDLVNWLEGRRTAKLSAEPVGLRNRR